MKPLTNVVLAAAALLAASAAEARPSHKDALIRILADATAWSEFCVHDAVNPASLAVFRDVHNIAVDRHYYEVYAAAYNRERAVAREKHRFHQACERALGLYGQWGASARDLVRPLWNGTVPDQMIDLDSQFR